MKRRTVLAIGAAAIVPVAGCTSDTDSASDASTTGDAGSSGADGTDDGGSERVVDVESPIEPPGSEDAYEFPTGIDIHNTGDRDRTVALVISQNGTTRLERSYDLGPSDEIELQGILAQRGAFTVNATIDDQTASVEAHADTDHSQVVITIENGTITASQGRTM